MAWNYQKELVIQHGEEADSKFIKIRICKSMNDELCVRICDEKSYELDEQGRYDMFSNLTDELEARNKNKGVNPRPNRNQSALNDLIQRMTLNEEDKDNDGAGIGGATYIMLEGMLNFYGKFKKYVSSNRFKFEPIFIARAAFLKKRNFFSFLGFFWVAEYEFGILFSI